SSEEIGDLPGLETLEYSHLPRRLPPYSSLYFGVALEDQVLDQYSDVPLFLLTCTNEIERIASDSFLISEERPLDPANLVHAYQQTALTSTLVELHRQFSHSLPSTGGSKSDVVRLTQLLKAFLRALPVSVIPEDHYRNFCGLSSVTSAAERTEAVHLFLAKLPHLHRVCLSHIMKHLDFVWFHQRKLQDYLATEPQELKNATSGSRLQHLCEPNSWLLVFRQILIRPPWPLLTDFAVGLEVHLRALQAVFFTLATTPSDIAPLGPAILNLPLPKKSLTEDSVESRCDADKFSRRNVVECFRFDNDSRLAWSKEEVGGIENVLASNDDPVLNLRLLFHLIVDADKLDYGTVEFSPLERLNTSQLSSPTIDTPPSPTSRAANARDLSTREWYWGDISPAGVREVMDGFSDGYFLVRDASANSVGAFTLAVRLHGENKLLRIYHRGDYFGVVDPPPPIFRLVSELIDYYRSHSIRVEEDILLRPISHRHYRFPRLAVSSTPTDPGSVCSVSESGDRGVFACNLSPNQLLVQLNRTNAELGQCESRIKELSDMAEQTMKSKDEASRSIKGYRKLQEWLQLQQQRLEQHSSLPSLERFHEVLHEKLLEAERQIKAGNQQFAVESNRCRDILKEQVHTTTRRRKLKRQAQEVHRALKHQGVPEDVILNHQNSNEETGGTLPTRSSRSSSLLTLFSREQDYGNLGLSIPKEITNSSAWFLPNVTREKAEQLLADKPSGTFLIRSSGDGSSLVLSVRVDSSVQHCLIHCDNGRYGFVRPPVQSFGSLEALVCHYHVYSLKQHNRLMTTTLRFPVNSNLL
ncbi:SH2 domain protein, partial [Opisthorchis viverrini]